MRFGRFILAMILACTCMGAVAQTVVQTPGTQPLRITDDLQAVAQRAREQKTPVLVAFMLKTCPYCRIARRDYLEPMQADEKWRDNVIMVEIELDTPRPLRDFKGNATTSRDFAKQLNVRSVPTVIVFDDQGEPAASPLVGLSSGDFYGLYLQQAIEAGVIKMRYPQR